MTAPRFDPAAIDAAKRNIRLSSIIGARVALAGVARDELVGRCPFHMEKTPSFTVNDAKGFYHCFGCGAHGDHIDFLMAMDGLDFATAVAALGVEAQRQKLPPPPPAVTGPGRHKMQGIDAARRLYAGGRMLIDLDPAESPVWRYLAGRGIDLRGAPDGIRRVLREAVIDYWQAAQNGQRPVSLGRYPAMLAPMVAPGPGGAERRVVGVHMTYLAVQGSRVGKLKLSGADGVALPAKKMRGQHRRAAIRFGAAAPVMGVAEGIENGLTMMQAGGHGFGPWELPMWVAGSLDNLVGDGIGRGKSRGDGSGKALPSEVPDPDRPGMLLPSGVQTLVLVEDADNADPAAGLARIQRGIARWAAGGVQRLIRVRPADGTDLNDLIRNEGEAS